MSYSRYLTADDAAPTTTGWDRWAEDYAALGTNSTYALAKDLVHEIVDEVSPPPRDPTTRIDRRTGAKQGSATPREEGSPRAGREAWVLDFHCGAGADLVRFLARGWSAVGCDGSPGMLKAAAARCVAALDSGRLELWRGRAEELEPDSFEARRFDLVFSTTGGLAYLDDEQFVRVHRVLASMLAPGGMMVIAHLTPFCVAESLYHVSHLRLGRAIERWRGLVPVTVRDERMLMRLRSPRHIRRLLAGVVRIERMAPLLWCTPPFQSGFVAPGPRSLAVLRAIERRTARLGALAMLADQVVCVARPWSSSSNKAM